MVLAESPAGGASLVLQFGGIWFFCLFLLQSLAEFTHVIPLGWANVAYALAATVALMAVMALRHATTAHN